MFLHLICEFLALVSRSIIMETNFGMPIYRSLARSLNRIETLAGSIAAKRKAKGLNCKLATLAYNLLIVRKFSSG